MTVFVSCDSLRMLRCSRVLNDAKSHRRVLTQHVDDVCPRPGSRLQRPLGPSTMVLSSVSSGWCVSICAWISSRAADAVASASNLMKHFTGEKSLAKESELPSSTTTTHLMSDYTLIQPHQQRQPLGPPGRSLSFPRDAQTTVRVAIRRPRSASHHFP